MPVTPDFSTGVRSNVDEQSLEISIHELWIELASFVRESGMFPKGHERLDERLGTTSAALVRLALALGGKGVLEVGDGGETILVGGQPLGDSTAGRRLAAFFAERGIVGLGVSAGVELADALGLAEFCASPNEAAPPRSRALEVRTPRAIPPPSDEIEAPAAGAGPPDEERRAVIDELLAKLEVHDAIEAAASQLRVPFDDLVADLFGELRDEPEAQWERSYVFAHQITALAFAIKEAATAARRGAQPEQLLGFCQSLQGPVGGSLVWRFVRRFVVEPARPEGTPKSVVAEALPKPEPARPKSVVAEALPEPEPARRMGRPKSVVAEALPEPEPARRMGRPKSAVAEALPDPPPPLDPPGGDPLHQPSVLRAPHSLREAPRTPREGFPANLDVIGRFAAFLEIDYLLVFTRHMAAAVAAAEQPLALIDRYPARVVSSGADRLRPGAVRKLIEEAAALDRSLREPWVLALVRGLVEPAEVLGLFAGLAGVSEEDFAAAPPHHPAPASAHPALRWCRRALLGLLFRGDEYALDVAFETLLGPYRSITSRSGWLDAFADIAARGAARHWVGRRINRLLTPEAVLVVLCLPEDTQRLVADRFARLGEATQTALVREYSRHETNDSARMLASALEVRSPAVRRAALEGIAALSCDAARAILFAQLERLNADERASAGDIEVVVEALALRQGRIGRSHLVRIASEKSSLFGSSPWRRPVRDIVKNCLRLPAPGEP